MRRDTYRMDVASTRHRVQVAFQDAFPAVFQP